VADDPMERAVLEAQTLVHDRRELLGEDHPETSDAMIRLARAHRDAGDARAAREVLERVLATQTRVLGEDHLETTRTAFELGLVLFKLGDLESARRVQERVLRTSDRDLGPDSELSLRAAINLANTLRQLALYRQEVGLRERTLDTRRRLHGPEHLDTYRATADLATVHHHLGNVKTALDLNQLVLEGYEANGVERGTIVALSLNIVVELIRLKRATEAAALFERTAAEAMVFLAPDDPLRLQVEKQRRAMAVLGTHARRVEEGRDVRRRRHS
jgi:tetratricopeptide (TPR) repeat protein